ncbi:uncharacterized protein LOC115826687 [Chanos chanos]|uniref:Uncharacterized protein LOC115826687 n=1 Tax=Chanos chanos TaxID=29144 RepID=A0A6J2WRL0_CHACN|nr:uncharacterized protein LOC115826687 [Chanos chanos]
MRSLWPLVWTVCGLSVKAQQTDETSVSSILLTTASPLPTEERTPSPTEEQTFTQSTLSSSDAVPGLSCVSLLPPRRGSYYVEQGTGVSVGSMLVFWCREGYQLVGSEKITCVVKAGVPRWNNHLPVCESIPKPDDRGLRVALVVSVVSGVVIFVMTVSFIVCCIQEQQNRKKKSHRAGRSRRREKRRSTFRRSPSWMEREEGEWEAFPPPKIFNLPQHLEARPLPPGSPLYPGVIRGYENRGYVRSLESLLRNPVAGVYHSDSQIYPHLVMQGVPPAPTTTSATTNTTPVQLHASAPPKAKASNTSASTAP